MKTMCATVTGRVVPATGLATSRLRWSLAGEHVPAARSTRPYASTGVPVTVPVGRLEMTAADACSLAGPVATAVGPAAPVIPMSSDVAFGAGRADRALV